MSGNNNNKCFVFLLLFKKKDIMDPSIVKKIIEYGKKRDVASLQNLIQTISEDDVNT